MNNEYEIIRPIGLDAVCSRIEGVCKRAAAYKLCGMVPESCIVQLDRGNGRSTIMEYAADKFRTDGVIDFSSGLDDIVSLIYDGTLQNFYECKSAVRDAAVYSNTYRGLYEVDCIALASHSSEIQYKDFFSMFGQICKEACVFFFVPSVLSSSEERFVEKIEALGGIGRVKPDPYTTSDYSKLIIKYLSDHCVRIDDLRKADTILRRAVNKYGPKSVYEAHCIASALVHYADLSGSVPVIDERMIKAFISETDNITHIKGGTAV